MPETYTFEAVNASLLAKDSSSASQADAAVTRPMESPRALHAFDDFPSFPTAGDTGGLSADDINASPVRDPWSPSEDTDLRSSSPTALAAEDPKQVGPSGRAASADGTHCRRHAWRHMRVSRALAVDVLAGL